MANELYIASSPTWLAAAPPRTVPPQPRRTGLHTLALGHPPPATLRVVDLKTGRQVSINAADFDEMSYAVMADNQ